ncbi:hypothetical protein [Staphylococcus haemolyticus]|nr:hypothetical protein [Staphylococcus haemolyticus]
MKIGLWIRHGTSILKDLCKLSKPGPTKGTSFEYPWYHQTFHLIQEMAL